MQTGPLLTSLVVIAFTQSVLPASAQNSTLISGGTVIDGSGAKRRKADVRIVGDTIREVGNLRARAGEKVIDATGLFVAPGFIDAHSHADGGLLTDPDAETQIRQGITTSVVGQDGGSHFPLASWFSEVEAKHVALNIASFVGHGTVRDAVTGKEYKRATTPDEQKRMADLVTQEMQSGGLGLSSGLEYDPGFYSSTDELIACARAAAKYHGIYISHVRDEGDKAFESFKELINIAQKGGLPAQISHIKLDTSPVWNKAPDVLTLMREARKRGLDISADVYPYTFWQSTIIVLIPTRDWSDRKAWETGLAEVGGPEHVRLTTYTPDEAWKGKTIAEISAMTGRDAITIIQEIVQKTHGEGAKGSETVVVTAMTDGDLDRFIAAPEIMFCTDGSLRPSHPRGAGSFPRLLGEYVRAKQVLTFEEAVRKATSLPAKRFGFKQRGRIARGMKADIVLFDPATVQDRATVAAPAAPPVGLPTVLVNGVPVLENGTITGAHPGAVLRHEVPTKQN
jgi:N-acyl-D-amino-acid deacylase